MTRSQQELAELDCPACRGTFHVPLWLVVDAGERPDLREAILTGTIHTAQCSHCGTRGTITAPLLYHDPTHEQLIAALPLSVARPEDAQALVSDLVSRLVASLPPEEHRPYLSSVALAAELDGLQAMLQPPEDRGPSLVQLQAALEELIDANNEEFRTVLVRHRSQLMRPEADELLETFIAQLRSARDFDRARRVSEQRALLARFRTTLAQRRIVLAELLDRLAPLSEPELAILEPLKHMLQAIDPQDVYAVRLQLNREQQALADRMIARLSILAEAEGIEPAVDYLTAIRQMQEQS